MLGVKLARAISGRQLIVKAWHGYHGSFADLEAGLEGQGEIAAASRSPASVSSTATRRCSSATPARSPP